MKHPEKNLLNEFALGNMDITMRLLVESHLNFCSDCELEIKRIREADMPEVEPSDFLQQAVPESTIPKLFGKIMTKIQVDEPHVQPTSTQLEGVIPEFLKEDIKPESEWEWTTMWPSKGKIGTVFTDPVSGYSLSVAFFKAGEKTPVHKHLDNEYTVMLQGGYSYDNTNINEGDWDTAEKGTSHSPKVHPDKDCWCIVRTKTVEPVRFEGIDSWRQPLIMLFKLLDRIKAG